MFTFALSHFITSPNCTPGGLFALKLIPALFGFAFEITISRLQTWSDIVRCGPMWSDAVISHTPFGLE